jgi:Recombinase/HNH endonuclease
VNKREEFAKLWYRFDKELPKECANCGSTNDLQIHHIVPLSVGGNNVLTNLVRLCGECHDKAHGGRDILHNSQNGQKKRADRGEWAAGTLPYGYKLERGNVIVDEQEADVIRLIYDLRYKSEFSVEFIAKILDSLSIPTKRGAKNWSHNAVSKLLKNPIYFGDYVFSGENYGKCFDPILNDEMREIIDEFNEKYRNRRMFTKKTIIVDGEIVLTNVKRAAS